MHRFLLIALLGAALTFASCDDDDPVATPTVGATATIEAPSASPTADGAALAISINEPAEGATVAVPFEVSGDANVFEGVLSVEVLDEHGDVLCRRNVQATSGTGTPGTWETTIAFDPERAVDVADDAAAPTLTIRAFNFSAMDGAEENVVTRDVTLDPEPPAIVIALPTCEADVAQGASIAVNGEAAVFEAALTVELRDASGTAVLTQNVMAASGVERSPWNTTLDLTGIEAGAYEIVAFSFSAEDGAIQDEFAVPIRIIPPA